MARVFWYSLVV